MSVIVIGYRNADTIVRAVRSVADQSDAGVEIVVVTSGADDSAALVRAAFPAVRVVESEIRLSPGGARNAGIETTTGLVVAFLAADCMAEPGWIAARRCLHDAGHPVVASAVTNGDRRHLAAWGFHFGVFGDRLAGRRSGPVTGTDGAAHGCSYARAVLEQLGRFDESVRIGEDTNASVALDRLGVPIWYAPAVRTAHWGPASTAALVQERYRRGCIRGRIRGPVAPDWIGVAGIWLRMLTRLPKVWRDAGGDRWWVVASLPWSIVGNAASLIGNQRAGRVGR